MRCEALLLTIASDNLWVGNDIQVAETECELIHGVADNRCLIETGEMANLHLPLTNKARS